MSEVQSRPAASRGRGSTRNGRGGHSSRGRGNRAHHNNISSKENSPPAAAVTSIREDTETSLMRKIYLKQISTIKEMFPLWTEEDILFALRETEADLELTVERITNGSISQWGEVPKLRKDRSRSKLNGPGATSPKENTSQTKTSRSGRNQNDSARGGRGRGADRGRGRGGKGRESPSQRNEKLAAVAAAAAAALEAAPWANKAAWQTKLTDVDADTSKWVEESLSSVILKPSSTIPTEGLQKSWATLFATKTTPPKPAAPKMKRPSESSKSEEPRKTPPIPETIEPVAEPVPAEPAVITPVATSFQASSVKANSSSGRAPNYKRRIFDQEEAVRMPGNREVDRTAVQFGAFGLKDSVSDDVDGDREEAETRAQPPQHSPVAPRAALPPVNHQQVVAVLAPAPAAPASVPDSLPTPKQPSGLPVASLPTTVPSLPSSAPQVQPHTVHSGTLTSAPNDYSSYYTTDPQQRNAYNSYYQQHYGSHHQGAQAQDVSVSQQRSYNGYSGPPGDSASPFPHSVAHQSHSRYTTAGEGQNSGHSTPNPVTQAPQQGLAAQAGQPQAAQQPQVPGTYPYGHPYYNSPYYAAYVNQYPSYGAGSYPGGPYAPKAAIHQQYQNYGISPGAPYDHTASPATAAFGVSSLHGRDSGLSGLSEYGRAGSAQSGQNPQALAGGVGFGSGHDAFARGSSYQGQQQQGGQPHYGSQQGGQQGGDDLKPFNESKASNGPNPSLQGGRPGSATNSGPGASALPPPHSQQAGYSGYPTHLQHQAYGMHGSQTGSQYGTLSGTGAQHQAAQGHQNSPYGGYPGFGGGNYYGNSQPQQRGGWGGNYGH